MFSLPQIFGGTVVFFSRFKGFAFDSLFSALGLNPVKAVRGGEELQQNWLIFSQTRAHTLLRLTKDNSVAASPLPETEPCCLKLAQENQKQQRLRLRASEEQPVDLHTGSTLSRGAVLLKKTEIIPGGQRFAAFMFHHVRVQHRYCRFTAWNGCYGQ